MADREDDQIPEQAGRGNCSQCGNPLAADQRYCIDCGARRGLLPGAVAGTLASVSSKGKGIAAAATGKAPKSDGDGDGGDGWSWMPSPPAIAIAVIGVLALGVGLGSAMSEVARSAPLSTILLEYPRHAVEGPPEEGEPESGPSEEVAEEAPLVAEAPAEETALPEEVVEEPLSEEVIEEPLSEEGEEEEESALQRSLRESEEEQKQIEEEEAAGGGEESLPQIKHAWLIVLGENSYEKTYGAAAEAPYLTRTLPKKGELLPNYYGVTSGVLANEIALLSGQGPTPETTANCPNYTAVAPATVSVFAEQVEGNGCLYPSTVKSLPTQLEEKELTWRSYSEDMENGGALGQPWRCRRPTLGASDSSTAAPGDQYVNWRNPAVYFGAIVEDTAECEKHDVGFEILTKDLSARKKTPALSLIFPNVCHSGGEVECEPGAPKGAKGVVKLLRTLVPAIMASPAYEEGGGLIIITSAQAPQAGEHPDPSACCLAPEYPNLLSAAGTVPTTPAPVPATPKTTAPKTTGESKATTATGEEQEEEATPAATKYTEESVLETGGGGQVGLLLISPLVEAGKVEEAEYANHFTLLKTLETMFGVEPLGYAAEEAVPTLSPELFLEPTAAEGEAPDTAETTSRSSAIGRLTR